MSGQRTSYGHPQPDGVCEWFVLCDNPATQRVRHPALGEVPTCDRCVGRMGLEGDVLGPVSAPAMPGA